MFAVVKTGGKQYRVTEKQVVVVEKVLGEVGDTHTFADVLMLEDGNAVSLGKPMVEGAKVFASIIEQGRGEKVIVFKKKRRHTYRRKQGHRQDITVLRIEQIAKPGEVLATSKPEQKEPTKAKAPRAKKASTLKVEE